MGTPAFAVPTLQALIDSPHRVAAVYTQPPRPAGRGQKLTPSPVQQLAQAHGIPVHTPVSFKSPEVQAQFAAHAADVAAVAAYGLLLPAPILQAYPLDCINIHPSLLPRWRGAAPIQRTLMAGDRDTGVCIMRMDEGLDTGDVLLREHFPIPDEMNAGALHDALAAIGARMLLETLARLDTLVAAPQAAEGVTYAAKITKDDGRIDWNRSSSEINDHIRALSPAPSAYFDYAGERVKIFSARPLPDAPAGAPGTILDQTPAIACGIGALQLLELQRPGKKRMPAAEALKGWSFTPGARLG
jgi:methionyl-tRNA formyltransferase